MRFWLSVVAGVVVITAIATGLQFATPELAPPPAREKSAEAKATPIPENAPRVQVDVREETLVGQSQMHTGESVFTVKNVGGSTLQLRGGAASCTCTDIRLEKANEVVKGKGLSANLEPGESAKFIMIWETQTRVGPFEVSAPLHTNDPRETTIPFRVRMTIERDFTLDVPDLNFGVVSEGSKAEKSVAIYTGLQEGVKFSDPHTSSPAFKATLVPLTADELKNFKAKSGVRLVVSLVGVLPVGAVQEVASLKSTMQRMPEIRVPIFATGEGNINLLPERVDFGPAANNVPHERRVQIFAKGLPEGRKLVVSNVEPRGITVKLVKDPNPEMKVLWRLTATLEPDLPQGPLRGSISISDDQGVRRLNIAVSATVTGPLARAPVASRP